MKHYLIGLTILIAGIANAHDGGHGPKVVGNPNERAVILAKEIKLGDKASQVFTAVLEKIGDDKIKIYMKPSLASGTTHDTSKFSESADVILRPTSSKKKSPKSCKLTRSITDGKVVYTGDLPHVGPGLYEIEVRFKHGIEEMYVEFPDFEGHSH